MHVMHVTHNFVQRAGKSELHQYCSTSHADITHPTMSVISDPEYVVGMATRGLWSSRATALPRPIAEPPPYAMMTSVVMDLANDTA